MTTLRPPVSVCMAAYNGSRYVRPQVTSILPQLHEKDELIIVDDDSQDDTRAVIESIGDNRVRLVRNDRNLGVVRSFERALALARGEIIFLSDQDDVWVPEKVAKVLDVFERHPDVTLVATDAALIDQNGVQLTGSYYGRRGKFRSGVFSNLLRCKYLGSTMAFRSGLLSKVMPFPDGKEVLHDIWIGVVNRISQGRTFFINEPLIWYRRHSASVTGGVLARRQQLRIRLRIVRAIIDFWVRNRLAHIVRA